GLYLGWRSPYIWGSEERLRGQAVWDMVDFILNGLVFILIGLQLSTILPALASRSVSSLIGLGLAISIALIVIRMVWVFADLYLRKWLAPLPIFQRSKHQVALQRLVSDTHLINRPKWKDALVVGWAGMRGVVSLAAALTLPANVPDRDLLIFLTFFVILV